MKSKVVTKGAGHQAILAGQLGCIFGMVLISAVSGFSTKASAAGPCVAGGVCCVGNVCGTLDQFSHNAEVACLRSEALENPSTADSIRAGSDCLAANIMESRVRAAIASHENAIDAQRKLRDELESHPDALEFQFRALTPKIEKFNVAAPVVLEKLVPIENRYRAITAKMADLLSRKRQLAGSVDFRVGLVRNQISTAMMQGPIALNQIHNDIQSTQWDFDTNVVPLGRRL